MIVSDDLVQKVQRVFDLNMYESRLWLALLSKSASTAGELSELANVPRSRAYDVLSSLEEKGLVEIKKNTRPLHYISVPPEEAIENSKKTAKKKAEKRKREFDEMKTKKMISEIEGLYEKGSGMVDSHEKTGIIRSKTNLTHQINQMINKADDELHIIAPAEELNYFMDHHLNAIKSANEKGIKINFATTKDHPEALKEFGKYGNVKVMNNVNSRMVLKDNSELLFMLFEPDEVHHMYDTGIWVTSPYFAGAVGKMFKTAFEGKK